MRREVAVRKDLTIKKIMKLVERQQIKMEALAEPNDKKAPKEERESGFPQYWQYRGGSPIHLIALCPKLPQFLHIIRTGHLAAWFPGVS